MRSKGVLYSAAALLLTACLSPVNADAAISRGFGVSPAYGQIAIEHDQAQVTYEIDLSSRNLQDQTFALSAVDFGSLDADGGVAFLGTATAELEHKYGLASWMRLPETMLTVPAGKSVTIPISILNQASLAPGGHYGALLATALTDGRGGPDSVGVKQVLSSLILVTKNGGIRQELNLVSETTSSGWWRLPKLVKQSFHNTGNVHLSPRGVVSVKDTFGREVLRGALNEDSKIILPETFRNYSAGLIPVAEAWWPGRYRIMTSYRYDGTDRVHSFEAVTWYAGTAIIWVMVAAVLLLVAGWVWWTWGRPRGWLRKR